MAFASINNTQLYYDLHGAEQPETIVMVHAGICDHRMWAAQVEHFAKNYRVVTLDMRGFGQSKMVVGAFAPHADLNALLEHLDIEKAWLMGCSMGGATVLDMVLRHPEKAKGLILVGSAISGYRYAGEQHPLVDKINAAYESGDMELTSELEVQLWVDGMGRTPDQVDQGVRDLVRAMNLIPLQVDEALWEQEMAAEPPALDQLEKINLPTLVIIGDLDLPASLERSDILAERIPNAKKVIMPNTAHVPNMEFPVEFNQLVAGFLK